MSDTFKFDVDDVGPDAENEEPQISGSSISDVFNAKSLAITPLTVLAVYTFLAKGAVVGALTSLFGGASTAAMVVATGLWVVGAVIVGAIGLMAVLTVVALLSGIVQRNVAKIILGLVGVLYFGVGYLGATMLFGYVPLLVGFMLTTTIVTWGTLLAIGGLVIVAGIIIA